jgi:Cys-rich repeat protein
VKAWTAPKIHLRVLRFKLGHAPIFPRSIAASQSREDLHMNKAVIMAVIIVTILVVVAVVAQGKKGCSSNADCAAGQVCQNGDCVAAARKCQTNADCVAGLACQASSGQCIQPPPPLPCKSNPDCPANFTCDVPSGKCKPPAVKPRRTYVPDCGNEDHLHGWFDAQGQGVPNDYCRYVFYGSPDKPWFACALAGGSDSYGTKGAYDPAKLRTSCDPTGKADCELGSTEGGCDKPLWT